MKWVLAILILGLLILFHELGHFILAKLNAVNVDEFSIGFGPRLISHVHKGTRYSLKLLPFGGSCIMQGMLDEEDQKPAEGSFNSKSVGRRAAIVAAGPIFNFLLAFILAIVIMSVIGYDPANVIAVDSGSPAAEAGLQTGDTITKFMGGNVVISRDLTAWYTFDELSAGQQVTMTVARDGKSYDISFTPDTVTKYRIGISYYEGQDKMEISSVTAGSPLANAGLEAGDVITGIDGNEITTSDSFADYISLHPLSDTSVKLTYERNGKTKETTLTPVLTENVNVGFDYSAGRVHTDALGVIKYSFYEVHYWIKTTVKSLGLLFTGKLSVNDLSGPVGVVNVVGTAYEESSSEGALATWMTMLNMIILLSANLGVMNLLPIPALDGGRLVFLVIEAIRGKPVNKQVEGAIELVAMALLMVLMVYVMYHDITKFF